MMRLLLSITVLVGSASMAFAQPAPEQAPTPTLKAKTRIVVVDVVVTDKEGQPIKNLQATDFALAENGATQRIDHFEAHAGLSAADAAKLPAMPKLEPNIFTNFSTTPENSALNVLLLDEENTKMPDKTVVLQQVMKYLATPHPGARMAIFELTSDLRLLQGFTSDPEVLRSALMNRKAVPHQSPAVDGANGCQRDPEHSETPPTQTTAWANKYQLGSEDYAQQMTTDECEENHLTIRSLATLKAMEALARYMGGLPGRKNLLWFSASFPITPNSSVISGELHRTMALFAKSQVAVYPIGSKGLAAPPAVPGRRVAQGLLNTLDAERSTMDKIAEDTGGKVFASSNDLAGEAEKAVDDGSNYYTLTYTPTNRDWKGEFRKVQVKLAEKGYTLAYRTGYYAEDLDGSAPVQAKENARGNMAGAAPDPGRSMMLAAMEYGSPEPAEIVFKAAINPATWAPESVMARGSRMVDLKAAGPYMRYVVSIAALPADFVLTREPGKFHLGVELNIRVYHADGGLESTTTYKADRGLSDAEYAQIMHGGVGFKREISVPMKGQSYVRIGLRDLATNHVGAMEVPVSALANLKPLTETTAAASK